MDYFGPRDGVFFIEGRASMTVSPTYSQRGLLWWWFASGLFLLGVKCRALSWAWRRRAGTSALRDCSVRARPWIFHMFMASAAGSTMPRLSTRSPGQGFLLGDWCVDAWSPALVRSRGLLRFLMARDGLGEGAWRSLCDGGAARIALAAGA